MGYPLNSVNNLRFRRFLQKWTKMNVPDQSTLSKNYVSRVYDEAILTLRNDFKNKRIWCEMDEVRDPAGRAVLCVVAGIMSQN